MVFEYIQASLNFLSLTYLAWSVIISRTLYHEVFSLSLTIFGLLTAQVGSDTTLILPSCFVGGICIWLSPISIIFPRSKRRPFKAQTLEILFPSEKLSSEETPENFHIDIVAVHGLASNPDSAWDAKSTKDGDGPDAPEHHNWLRDALPKANLKARIMAFNHNTAWRADALGKSLREHGHDLLHALRSVRTDHNRPIVFIGHSFGGLIIKQAIVIASQEINNDYFYEAIVDNTHGFIFIGVPHRGSKLTLLGELASVLGYWKGSRTNLLEVLRPDSDLNKGLHESFNRVVANSGHSHGPESIICVYETKSETLFGFPIAMVVSKESAVIDGSVQIGYDVKHRYLQRFSTAEDHKYKLLIPYLKKWAKAAEQAIQLAESVSLRARDELTLEARMTLQSLSFEEMNRRQLDVTEEASDTCAWVLDHPIFRKWWNGMLWIKGKPGAGKSTIMNYILKSRHPKGVLAYYFVTGRGTELQKSCAGVYRALLHQILSSRPELCSELVFAHSKKCKIHGDYGTKWTWHDNELKDHLRSAMFQASAEAPIEIFVDALDEAGESEAVVLLEYFLYLAGISDYVAICVSSRHYPLAAFTHELVIVVEDNNSRDIMTYIESRLSGKVRDKAKIKAIKDELIKTSSGVFQWVFLVLPRVIRSCNYGKSLFFLLEEIRHVPRELDQLYRSLLSEVDNKIMLLRLIRWACFSLRPLTLTEMRHAIAIDSVPDVLSIEALLSAHDFKDNDDGMANWVLDISRGLLEVRSNDSRSDLGTHSTCVESDSDGCDNSASIVGSPPVQRSDNRIVQPGHQSLKDFVLGGGLRQFEDPRYADEFGTANYLILTSCVRYISAKELLHSLPAEVANCGFAEAKSTEGCWRRVLPSSEFVKFPLLGYAAGHWIEHGIQVENSKSKEALCGLVDLFPWPSSPVLELCSDVNRESANNPLGYDCSSQLLIFAARFGFSHTIETIMREKRLCDNDTGMSELQRALWYAARYGHDAVIKVLLRSDQIDPNLGRFGKTPLACAARHGHGKSVKLLLEDRRADPNVHGRKEDTPLACAILQNSTEVISSILDDARTDPNLPDSVGRTPLSYAAEDGHQESVKLLLADIRVDPNIPDWAGRTPLGCAIYAGNEETVTMLLQDERTDLERGNINGQHPLSIAVARKAYEIVKLLLRNSRLKDVTPRNTEGKTPLMALAESYPPHKQTVEAFVEDDRITVDSLLHGPKPPLHYAAGLGLVIFAVQLIEDKKNMVDARDETGLTPLHCAARANKAAMLTFLIKRGAEVDSKDHLGRTALMTALMEGHLASTRVLLEHGADANTTCHDGWGPLIYTVKHFVDSCWTEKFGGPDKMIEAIQLLVEAGTNLHGKDKSGMTILWHIRQAQEKRYEDRKFYHGGEDDASQYWPDYFYGDDGGYYKPVVQYLKEHGCEENDILPPESESSLEDSV